MELTNELVNHIFIYCQGNTNKIMKEHINSLDEYKDRYYHDEESYLKYILHLMAVYGQIHFDKQKFNLRFYRCTNCNRVGYYQPHIEFGEKFCSYICADLFDY
jgi:hypothetical protein